MKQLNLKSKILLIVLICSMLAIFPIAIISLANIIQPTNPPFAADYYSDSSHKVFEIYTLTGLKKFRDNVNGGTTYSGWTVSLQNNIENIGSWNGIGTETKLFKGTFNGKGHYVSGITQYNDNGDGSFGFFGCVVDATIKNFTIKNSTIKAEKRGSVFAGILVGAACSDGTGETIITAININNVTMNARNTKTWGNVWTGGLVGSIYQNSTRISNCSLSKVALTSNNGSGDDGEKLGGISGFTDQGGGPHNQTTITNCYFFGSLKESSVTKAVTHQPGLCNESEYTKITKCLIVLTHEGVTEIGSSRTTWSQSQIVVMTTLNKSQWAEKLNSCEIKNSNSMTVNTFFIPQSNEYNKGYPIYYDAIKIKEYKVKSADINQGTVSVSSLNVPEPKDDSSTKYNGIPSNNSTAQSFFVVVVSSGVDAVPTCNTCRQFSHWEVDSSTITAHFKEKEVPANCSVGFVADDKLIKENRLEVASNVGSTTFKLYPGSRVKCEMSNNGTTYTYIVIKGGNCLDCGRSLTNGEEYARITYTLKKDDGQPVSRYELVDFDSKGLIKSPDTEYIIEESTTISPIFKLKEYGIVIS